VNFWIYQLKKRFYLPAFRCPYHFFSGDDCREELQNHSQKCARATSVRHPGSPYLFVPVARERSGWKQAGAGTRRAPVATPFSI